ncbi:MAG: metal ABC transporter ATP-binding protein [Firmicutes bacterium]|nr:metal ABC transporter ATP-binding protein [Bacillota bacterium]
MAHLICRNVSMSYEGRTVVDNLSLELPRGAYLCIIGENGTGKSTLVKGVLGLKQPSSGQILFGEGLLQRQIGYLPQQSTRHREFPASVREVVMSGFLNQHGYSPFYKKEEKVRAKEVLSMLGIGELEHRSIQALSGGQQQRVLLARALCAASSMLLLDEPTAGLDAEASQEMYELLERLHQEQKMTILMVTHHLAEVKKYATHILRLRGDGYFFGTVAEYEEEVGKNG